MKHCDVIVVGGGHAGCEAAASAARMGAKVILVTLSIHSIGAMSCNPSIGGVGKGHLVREVDALDGLVGRAADAAALHYRMLNRSKGPAVHGPRIQADRVHFAAAVRRGLDSDPRITIVEGEATELIVTGDRCVGLILADGTRIESAAVVLATGTFLRARMFCGDHRVDGGRRDERAAARLGQQLEALGLPIGRLKTGTPPRLDGRTIDWAQLSMQSSESDPWTMSPLGRRQLPQLSCAITRTCQATHDVIRAHSEMSPLWRGDIVGVGPRYCPSIEDKVRRFGDRDGHQIFLEPESLRSELVYPNGISTSLAPPIQEAFVRTVVGFERARVVIPGYAVEYDFIDPRALDRSLEVKGVRGLFFSGQINGTTGYEEAAAQGLVAGLNAAARAMQRPSIIFDRDRAYIGVLIDDLVLQGVNEPYRMLTARAEHRLALRADNAATRLTDIGIEIGCIGDSRQSWWMRRKQHLALASSNHDGACSTAIEEVETDRRYAPFVARQQREVTQLAASDALVLPAQTAWSVGFGLSQEMVERLTAAQPRTFGEARRIQGMTPAALAALLIARKTSIHG